MPRQGQPENSMAIVALTYHFFRHRPPTQKTRHPHHLSPHLAAHGTAPRPPHTHTLLTARDHGSRQRDPISLLPKRLQHGAHTLSPMSPPPKEIPYTSQYAITHHRNQSRAQSGEDAGVPDVEVVHQLMAWQPPPLTLHTRIPCSTQSLRSRARQGSRWHARCRGCTQARGAAALPAALATPAAPTCSCPVRLAGCWAGASAVRPVGPPRPPSPCLP
eukprot:355801-Chlamydomonas_euryale.AAC.1